MTKNDVPKLIMLNHTWAISIDSPFFHYMYDDTVGTLYPHVIIGDTWIVPKTRDGVGPPFRRSFGSAKNRGAIDGFPCTDMEYEQFCKELHSARFDDKMERLLND